jgi:tRNA threonylcarbamoyladenosine biosynthesis protein TsaE
MSSVLRFESHSDEETLSIGKHLADVLPSRGVVLLLGELGAGKTTLAKGIVEGRGAASSDEVSSPTFTLIHEFGDPVRVYHIDLYRLDTAEQARRLGVEEIFAQDALVLIEWGDRFPEILPERWLEIRLTAVADEEREIEVHLPEPV